MYRMTAPEIGAASRAVLRVSLDALVSNYRLIARRVAPARVAGVIKANAYGLGARPVARALAHAGCRHFFVAMLSEATQLMDVIPPQGRVYILNGLLEGQEACCAKIGAVPVINSLEQLAAWAAQSRQRGRRLPAALQIDSGMARLGLPPQDVATLIADRHRFEHIHHVLLMSHLACADDPDCAENARQAARFEALAEHFPGVPRSLDNSGGAFLNRNEHYDIVRAGIALYGGAPHHGQSNPMRPVVSLSTPILQIREIPAGACVGYGQNFTANRPSRIATIGIGYADGWLRRLEGRSGAYIAGKRVPLAGRVSMDSITLDVTDLPLGVVRPGTMVELLGAHQTIDDVAADADTISYEVLTRLGDRFAREYTPCGTHSSQAGHCA